MPAISTNAIRDFAEKVRVASMTNAKTVNLTQQEAKNLNHEIQQLLAVSIENISKTTAQEQTTVEITPGRW